MQQIVGVLPGPVEVLAGQAAALVAVDDAVGVDHGHDFEDEGVAQQFGLLGLRGDEVDEAAHHPAAVGLAGVAARGDHDPALLLLLRVVAGRGHGQVPEAVAAQGFAQFASDHEFLAVFIC